MKITNRHTLIYPKIEAQWAMSDVETNQTAMENYLQTIKAQVWLLCSGSWRERPWPVRFQVAGKSKREIMIAFEEDNFVIKR